MAKYSLVSRPSLDLPAFNVATFKIKRGSGDEARLSVCVPECMNLEIHYLLRQG